MKDARAAGVAATPHAYEFTGDERVGGRFDDRDDEAGEGVTDGDEGASERSVGTRLETTNPGAAPEHAVDLGEGVAANLLRMRAAFGERAKGGAHATRVDQRGGGTRGLLLRAAAHPLQALGVEDAGDVEKSHQRLEVTQEIETRTAAHVVGVHEVQPEPLTDEDERRGGRVCVAGCVSRCGVSEGRIPMGALAYPALAEGARSAGSRGDAYIAVRRSRAGRRDPNPTARHGSNARPTHRGGLPKSRQGERGGERR